MSEVLAVLAPVGGFPADGFTTAWAGLLTEQVAQDSMGGQECQQCFALPLAPLHLPSSVPLRGGVGSGTTLQTLSFILPVSPWSADSQSWTWCNLL